MDVYFSTNDHYYSKAHRYIAKEPFTHIGLGFFTDKLKLVVDCTKPHGKLYHLDHWLTKYYLTNQLRIELDPEVEQKFYELVIKGSVNVPYDWGAYAYAWLAGIRNFLFNTPYPNINPWGGSGKWCTEVLTPIVQPLFEETGVDFMGLDLAAKTPCMIYKKLKTFSGVQEIEVEA